MARSRPNPRPWPLRASEAMAALLILAVPLVIFVSAKDPFRLPKLLAAEWLALASLLPLAFLLLRREAPGGGAPFRETLFREALSAPVVRVVVPILVVAGLSLLATEYPIQVRSGLADLWIGAAALVGWSLAFSAERLRRLLGLMLWPAALLVAVGFLQYLDLWEPLRFSAGEEATRLGVTSLAGNPGDLGAYLVLPCLLALHGLARSLGGGSGAGSGRVLPGVLLAVSLLGIGMTQSITAVSALAVSGLVFALLTLPRKKALLALGGGAAALALVVLLFAPLRARVIDKSQDLLSGDVNALLTGRLDGWWAALWMLRTEPLNGVGHGAYRPAFIGARLALADEGVEFFSGQQFPVFANAHNEYLEAAGEWGLPGVAALLWAGWVILGRARRIGAWAGGAPSGGGAETGGGKGGKESRKAERERRARNEARADRALAWSGLASLAVLSLTFFPMRVALTAYPQLVFLAWVLARSREAVPVEADETAAPGGEA